MKSQRQGASSRPLRLCTQAIMQTGHHGNEKEATNSRHLSSSTALGGQLAAKGQGERDGRRSLYLGLKLSTGLARQGNERRQGRWVDEWAPSGSRRVCRGVPGARECTQACNSGLSRGTRHQEKPTLQWTAKGKKGRRKDVCAKQRLSRRQETPFSGDNTTRGHFGMPPWGSKPTSCPRTQAGAPQSPADKNIKFPLVGKIPPPGTPL